MNVSDFEYENKVQFDLVGEDGLLDKVMETNLQRAINYFKNNYSGYYEIYWFVEKVHVFKITL